MQFINFGIKCFCQLFSAAKPAGMKLILHICFLATIACTVVFAKYRSEDFTEEGKAICGLEYHSRLQLLIIYRPSINLCCMCLAGQYIPLSAAFYCI